jgi:hypothetical protein
MLGAFAHLTLPEISTVARRTALMAVGIGALAVVALGLAGYLLAGLGVCLGLALAMVNFRLIARATVKATAATQESHRRPLAINTLARLGAISVVALGLVFLDQPFGFGTLVGLAVFQFTLLANVTVCMVRGMGPALPPSNDRGEDGARG